MENWKLEVVVEVVERGPDAPFVERHGRLVDPAVTVRELSRRTVIKADRDTVEASAIELANGIGWHEPPERRFHFFVVSPEGEYGEVHRHNGAGGPDGWRS